MRRRNALVIDDSDEETLRLQSTKESDNQVRRVPNVDYVR